MHRTTKLITTVTASLLLAGSSVANAGLPRLESQTAPQNDGAEKTDPKIDKAADAIYEWLKGTTEKEAKTQDDVSKKFPALGSDLVEKALNQLIKHDLHRAGDGTQDSPYRYFEYCSHCG
jgi:hypothetical protein